MRKKQVVFLIAQLHPIGDNILWAYHVYDFAPWMSTIGECNFDPFPTRCNLSGGGRLIVDRFDMRLELPNEPPTYLNGRGHWESPFPMSHIVSRFFRVWHRGHYVPGIFRYISEISPKDLDEIIRFVRRLIIEDTDADFGYLPSIIRDLLRKRRGRIAAGRIAETLGNRYGREQGYDTMGEGKPNASQP